jgi:hypothetical protein
LLQHEARTFMKSRQEQAPVSKHSTSILASCKSAMSIQTRP